MKTFVVGHKGMVESALVRKLQSAPEIEVFTRDRSKLDHTDRAAVADFTGSGRPDEVKLAPA